MTNSKNLIVTYRPNHSCSTNGFRKKAIWININPVWYEF